MEQTEKQIKETKLQIYRMIAGWLAISYFVALAWVGASLYNMFF